MNAITRPVRHLWLTFDEIDLPDNGRPTNATDVVALARSIEALGLQVPLTCVERSGRYLLIAGRHRLEALRYSGARRPLSASSTSTTSRHGCGRSPRTCTGPN